MEWKTHGERQIYTNKWVNLCLVDVQQPDGRRWECRTAILPEHAASVGVHVPASRTGTPSALASGQL